MGKETKIEWCDSTVNPTDFQCCGCELWNKQRRDCYAGRFAERRAGKGAFDKPVVLKPGRMAEAARWSDLRGTKREGKPWIDGRPRIIFIGDMADTLQPSVPFEYLKTEIIDVVASKEGRRHVWMWLTKQSNRFVEFQSWYHKHYDYGDFPNNLWPGVSVTSERTTWRIDELVKIKSAHRFISYEPAWEYVDFSRWTCGVEHTEFGKAPCPSLKIETIIMGGQSGSGINNKPFHLQWAADTKEICEDDQVNFFLKQIGSNPVRRPDDEPFERIKFRRQLGSCHHESVPYHPKGGDWSEWPADLRVRQFPEL